MLIEVLPIVKQALMITGFVFVMMLIIEYVNVQTKGLWQNNISQSKWKQYAFAAFLGAIPGCLGAFTAVALYSHRLISFGAIVTAMIATSGDEAFVMLAMFPLQALGITLLISVVGVLSGYLADKIPYFTKLSDKFAENKFPLHEEEKCECFTVGNIFAQLKNPSFYRINIVVLISIFLIAVGSGMLAGNAELWIKITIISVVSISLFIVLTVPEHFLKEHLWDHIVKVHILRIFLWTFGTLFVIHFAMNYFDINSFIENNMFVILIIAVLIGVIPESGPHLIFVTLFAAGTIPLSVLVASSISQDGHGMIPLLAESKLSFLSVKAVNIVVALIVGGSILLLGH
ncbi:MAG: arsenic efflux protein [Bacteroidetes bacterium]|nr:arsenic efflux protein [Bacteroidota bacterium]MBU1115894.1 arsenic efflux protein [Bacteroidota bacterium]MBU1798747.1 arsenic efflux protein [Bacteroidota bacterium]